MTNYQSEKLTLNGNITKLYEYILQQSNYIYGYSTQSVTSNEILLLTKQISDTYLLSIIQPLKLSLSKISKINDMVLQLNTLHENILNELNEPSINIDHSILMTIQYAEIKQCNILLKFILQLLVTLQVKLTPYFLLNNLSILVPIICKNSSQFLSLSI